MPVLGLSAREGAGLCRAGSREEQDTSIIPAGKLSPAHEGTCIHAGEGRDWACTVRTKTMERNLETRKGDLSGKAGVLEGSGRYNF